jgi:hypothetical protein
MISMMAMACVIFYAFAKLMTVAMVTEWDVQPVMILFLVFLSAVRLRTMIHRRLT